MESWTNRGWVLWMVAALVAMVAGCETASMDNQGTVSLAELQGIAPEPAPTATTNTTPNPNSDTNGAVLSTNSASGEWPSEINGSITWLHTDVSSWPVTASLDASVSGGSINMPYSKARVWPARDGVNANPWVIVKWTDGKWYAGTFEWLRHGQTSKPVGVLDGSKGDHIKVSPLNRWRPHSGERIGIMVSGLARTQMRNVRERSNVDMITWP